MTDHEYRLGNGEHVLTAAAVHLLGGEKPDD